MVKLDDIKTDTYWYKDGFLIEIVDKLDMYEAYLYHKDYGIKELMFGIFKAGITYNDFLDTVKINLETDYYIQSYIKDYFDKP